MAGGPAPPGDHRSESRFRVKEWKRAKKKMEMQLVNSRSPPWDPTPPGALAPLSLLSAAALSCNCNRGEAREITDATSSSPPPLSPASSSLFLFLPCFPFHSRRTTQQPACPALPHARTRGGAEGRNLNPNPSGPPAMGQCYGKAGGASSRRADHDAHAHAHAVAPPSPLPANGAPPQPATPGRRKSGSATPVHHQAATTAWPSPYPAGGASPLPAGVSPSPARSTPRRFFKRPFPPPSPAKHIKATLAKRLGGGKPKEGTIPEEGGAGVAADSAEAERPLDKTFGFANNFGAKYDLGKEVGRGHFGHTCSALVKKGEYKGHAVAVKIISKAKVLKALLVGGGGGGGARLMSNSTFLEYFEISNSTSICRGNRHVFAPNRNLGG
jgi:hypothetical protein